MTLRQKKNICLICSKEFIPAFRHPNQKYCSEHTYTYKRSENTLISRKEKYKTDVEYRQKQIERSRNAKLLNVYGISEKEYLLLLKKQNGCCAICEIDVSSKAAKFGKKRLAVDHCHSTGKIRGLLCTNCNISLGGFKDSINLLEKAINYIKESHV